MLPAAAAWGLGARSSRGRIRISSSLSHAFLRRPPCEMKSMLCFCRRQRCGGGTNALLWATGETFWMRVGPHFLKSARGSKELNLSARGDTKSEWLRQGVYLGFLWGSLSGAGNCCLQIINHYRSFVPGECICSARELQNNYPEAMSEYECKFQHQLVEFETHAKAVWTFEINLQHTIAHNKLLICLPPWATKQSNKQSAYFIMGFCLLDRA